MAIDLENRLKKKYTAMSKWAKQNQISCYRIYSKDLAEYPFILDAYDSNLVVWLYERKKDVSIEQKQNYFVS